MSDSALLAIDVGTGSCRAALFDVDGNALSIAQREYRHPPESGVPGSQVFETDRIWSLICGCVREALVTSHLSSDSIRAVSATSMREGMVLYDAAGDEIWACPNADSRASEEAAELVRSGAAAEIYALGGDWVAITAPARFRWLAKQRPEIFRSIAAVGMLGDWILHRLCDVFVTDPSLGSSSGMFDLAERRWSPTILDLCGLEPRVFPEVTPSGTVVGAVTARAAEGTGLREGTPVVTGGADTQLGLVGIGVTKPGRFTIVGGTFWQQTLVLDQAVVDPKARLRTLCHTVPGQWMVEGIGFYSGLALRRFRDAFCEADKTIALQQGVDVYSLLDEQAASVPPGANGVVGIFSNLMEAGHWVHATPSLLGFDIANPQLSGKKECFRAIQEGAAYVSRGHLEILEEISGLAADEVVLTGGASRSNLWPKVVADVLGLPVRVPKVKESTALGAALYAGLGIGLFDDLATVVERVVQFEDPIIPNPTAHSAYLSLYEHWLAVYQRALELTENTGLPSLWRAAGT